MELWRRLILLVCVCSGAFLFSFASLSPLVIAQSVDFSEKQKKEGAYRGLRIPTAESDSLAALSLQEYIDRVTKGRLVRVEGEEWSELFEAARAVAEGRIVGKEWQQRLPPDRHPMGVLFFRHGEPPVSLLSSWLRLDNDAVYLSMADGVSTSYLKLEYKAYSDEDFHIGSGLSDYPHPPDHMLYPFRRQSLGLIVFGVGVYIVLPWPRRSAGQIRYSRWRIVAGDLVSLILITFFFSLPFLITGGSVQAFTQAWPLLLLFWPIVLMGVWLLIISARLSGFSITLLRDGLSIATSRGERAFSFEEMEHFQPVVFRPPRWLIGLSWVAALSGRGTARAGATGRAMILSGSASGCLCVGLRNGAEIFIAVTDMTGGDMMKGVERVLHALRDAGVQERPETREIRSLGLETLRLPD